jgi:hypothetical protein
MLTVNIYRDSTLILSVEPNETSNIQQRIMSDNLLTLQFDLNSMVELKVGDYTLVYGTTFLIHSTKLPTITKKSQYLYEYDVQMVGTQYLLQNAQYLFLGADNNLTQPDFSLYGTANDFIDLLISNAARTGIAWTKGGVVESEYKNLTFSAVDCLAALGTLAEAFGTEWYVEGTTVNLAQKQQQTPYTFLYGKHKGMYEIKRTPSSANTLATRLYVFGGETNIPLNYRNGSTRLLLPAVADPKLVSNITYVVTNNNNGTETITFDWDAPTDDSVTAVTIMYRYVASFNPFSLNTGSKNAPRSITVPNGTYEVQFRSELTGGATLSTGSIYVNNSNPYPIFPPSLQQAYIEHNTNLFGIIEQTLIFNDIYPHRTGIVTGFDITDFYSFTDSSIDFDINAQLLPGTSAKVVFNTGQLAGYTFEINRYNNVTKTITINKNKDEKTLDIPSDLLHMQIGDEYVLVDIVMPQSYISNAESLLLVKAQDYLNTYSEPAYNYSGECDPIYFRAKNIKLNYGDIVRIKDTELNVYRAFRIISITKPLTDEYAFTIELGDAIATSIITQLSNAATGNSNSISNINQSLENNKLLAGTNIGNFTIEQGTLYLKDIETAADTTGMLRLFIDANGKVWMG